MSLLEIILYVVLCFFIFLLMYNLSKTNEKISKFEDENKNRLNQIDKLIEARNIDFNTFLKKYNEQYQAQIEIHNQLKDTTLIQFTEIQTKIQDAEKLINDVDSITNDKMLSFIGQSNEQFERVDKYVSGLNNSLEDISTQHTEQLKEVVDFLLKKLDVIKMENDDLRKKLEHFSEISDDSTTLNIAVDIDKENELIESILRKKEIKKVDLDKPLVLETVQPKEEPITKEEIVDEIEPVGIVEDSKDDDLSDEYHEEFETEDITNESSTQDLVPIEYQDIEELCNIVASELNEQNSVYIKINNAYSHKELVNSIQKITSITSLYPDKKVFYIRFDNHNISSNSVSQFFLKSKVEVLPTTALESTDIKEPQVEDSTPQIESTDSTGISLDAQQEIAYKYMENTNHNLFISGKAGTGKSFLLKVFSRGTNKKHLLIAPTGIAALNVNGATIHSTFGFENLKLGNDLDIIKLKNEKKELLKQVDVIIIDEISMVRADVLDKLDAILRKLNNTNQVFGGKQIFLFGDLFQLPPIANKTEYRYLMDQYNGVYFFHSNAYKNGDFRFVELSKNHRQEKDHQYFNILNNIREGKTSKEDIGMLNSRYIKNQDLRRVLKLFPKKDKVEEINNEELSKIKAKEYQFDATVEFSKTGNVNGSYDALFPINMNLKLKLGALVMMVKNDLNNRWVNGTLGIVSYISNETLKVTINGKEYSVDLENFDSKEATYKNGKIYYETVLRVKQYPLVLAYAITIHKSQGMTYQNVACDLTETFTSGQSYVALSRCVSLEGLHLLEKITGHEIETNSDIVAFYSNIKNPISETTI